MSDKPLPPATGPHVPSGLYVKAQNGLRLRDQRVRRLVRKMRVAMPWLEDVDIPAARAWAQLEVLADQVYAWLRVGNVVNNQGEGKTLLDDFRKLRQAQLTYARELGMTPTARMALKASGTKAAFDLVAAFQQSNEEAEEAASDEADGKDVPS